MTLWNTNEVAHKQHHNERKDECALQHAASVTTRTGFSFNSYRINCPKLADVIEELHINFKYYVKI
jgi:hypothetical protein